MGATLNYQLKDAPAELFDKCRWSVLTMFILHANIRNRCWPSMRGLSHRLGLSLPYVTEAKQWLVEHEAITIVPNEERSSDEKKLHGKLHVYQLTGYLKFGDLVVPYFYINPNSGQNEPDDQPDESKDVYDQRHGSSMINGVYDKHDNAQTISSKDSTTPTGTTNTSVAPSGTTGATSPVAIVDAIIDQGLDDLDTMVSKVTVALESTPIEESLESGKTLPPAPSPLEGQKLPLPPDGFAIVYSDTPVHVAHLVKPGDKEPRKCQKCHANLGMWSQQPGDHVYPPCGDWTVKPKSKAEPKPWSALTKAMHEAIPEAIRPIACHYGKHDRSAKLMYDLGYTPDQVTAYVTDVYANDSWFRSGGSDGTPIIICMSMVADRIKAWEAKRNGSTRSILGSRPHTGKHVIVYDDYPE